MNQEIKLIDIKKSILEDNQNLAEKLRDQLRSTSSYMVNFMASPGAGKTSVILKTAGALKDKYQITVLEADVDSIIDAQKISDAGIPSLQIKTGGFCHLNAAMVKKALDALDTADRDLIIIENIGNLICPAESDTGSFLNIVILSVPEGHDKPYKYPGMFQAADALIINKIDYPDFSEFDMNAVKSKMQFLNPTVPIFPLSSKTGEGLSPWLQWFEKNLTSFLKNP